jgi:hypothetical protein
MSKRCCSEEEVDCQQQCLKKASEYYLMKERQMAAVIAIAIDADK